jgi:hypothetical protein
MRTWKLAATGVFLGALGAPGLASADEVLFNNPGDHPSYRFEIEPHVLLGFGGPFRLGHAELGGGLRGTVVLLDNGFIRTINNSVGVTFGGDVFFCGATVFLPVAMQWNFWLTNHFSVFAEPGLGLTLNNYWDRDSLHPILSIGGRYHFTDHIALTVRAGYPALSIGASFF